MKKTRINWLKIFFVFAAAILMGTVAGIVTSKIDSKAEFLLGLSSVVVTIVLGVVTYYQTREQTKIDMLDKTPYFRIVKDEGYKDHANAVDVDANALYEYTKFLRYQPCGDPVGAVVQIDFENISDCIIKKITKYVCEDKKYSEGGEFVKYSESKVVKICKRDRNKAGDVFSTDDTSENEGENYRNNFNLNQHEFDLTPNDKFEVAIRLADDIDDPPKSYDFSIALEIETIHGYVYTQYMIFSVERVPVYLGADWVTITDYDVEIAHGRIKEKLLKK